MKPIRTLVLAALLVPALPAQAAEEEWPAFGHALTLIHTFVRIAAESSTPQQSLQAVDDVLSGRNVAANEAVAGLFREMLADMPREHRATIAAIGRDLVTVARKSIPFAGAPAAAPAIGPMQARKDLTAIGLSYHDSKQFLDAVKRNDIVAAELFIAAKGVDLSVTDFWGRDAVEFARANKNDALAELILRNRPAAR